MTRKADHNTNILAPRAGNADLDQWFTPAWAAEALIARHFPGLDSGDLVLEPSCGAGAFLGAIPASVPAIGIEIDPGFAAAARAATGRRVIEGDFRTVDLDFQPSAIIGNPPFALATIEGFLARAHGLLPEGGRMGLILPAYAFQTSGRLTRWAERWSIISEALPRDLFPGLSKPLAFLLFSKDAKRSLVGFALYREQAAIKDMPARAREILARAVGRSAWKTCLAEILATLGGEAELEEIYRHLAPKRPTANPFWKEQARKALQQSFRRTGRGRWALPELDRAA